MTLKLKAGLATASLALAAAIALPATAADLGNGNWGRGSIKDQGYASAPSQVGNCYWRADIGASLSSDPTLNWNATDQFGNINSHVSNSKADNSRLVEAGFGCGSGSRGLRSDFMLGYHGERDISGTTGTVFTGFDGAGNPISNPATIRSTLSTYTAMANVYYDLGSLGGFVPYVGAGVGVAYHRASEYTVSYGQNYAVAGANDLSLAWGLMAGAGYQISDRAILDVGYRYLDMGSAATARNDTAGMAQVTRLHMTDLTAHEFKVGLRYHFGGNCCSANVPLK
jgi:opacity protein-like surface antigen